MSSVKVPERLSGLVSHQGGCGCCCGKDKSNQLGYTLRDLPYAYDALEPYIDAQTVAIHHDKHHATYVNNLNKAIEGHTELAGKSVCELLKNLDQIAPEIRNAVRNQGGGVSNHNFYWKILGPDNKGAQPVGELAAAIDKYFGSFSQFRDQLTKASVGQFGSGWGWLTLSKRGELAIESTSNQDSPLSAGKFTLMTIDVWEHAYYLKYQNKRPDYVNGIWNLFNWDFISERYVRLMKELQ